MRRLFLFSALCLTGCERADSERLEPRPEPEAVIIAELDYARVAKSCDAGRAVYLASRSGGGTAVFVIDKAPECAK